MGIRGEGMVTAIDVRDAVIGALGEAFPGLPIHTETVDEGVVKPCFFVKDFPVAQSRIMGRRYARAHSFDIQYFPLSAIEPIEEAHDAAERLTEALEYIPLEVGQVRGTGMRYEFVDSVLHFFVNVNLYMFKPIMPVPLMGSVEVEEGIK
ncbi:DUF6838 family protein [Cohnella faecalis]|uniref:Uncharacterized protein n=1 Tax=Cohnella faecalis TaxID=2315694 RepID=A0A398CEZ8_9BACL|nr:hypothetical protein [Cohnella faecalis]RIE01303.1 hypothetical protein D3H35_23250 [Cohnella faecalis]